VNFQNIPRDDKTVKRAILPKRGSFSYFDYGRIEPYLTAYFAEKIGHPEFANQLRAGVDAYTAVARLSTGKESITPEERNTWKRIFLAILYGAGVKRVREVWIEETKEVISLDQARRIYNEFHRNWPTVRILQDSVIATHNKRGYLRTPWGRQLHAEEFGEHKLLNKLIQGSAADLMKQALLQVDAWLLAHPEVESRMVSVVHDEIIFDGPEHEIPLLHEKVPDLMRVDFLHNVIPIDVDHEVSTESWAEKMSYEEWEATRDPEAVAA
jgi:DNA polymerase I